jgi:hypothetical protein
MDRLVEILHDPDFSIDNLPKTFNAAWENRNRDQQEEKLPHLSLKGFQETNVKVEVPFGDKNIRSRFRCSWPSFSETDNHHSRCLQVSSCFQISLLAI